MPEVQHAFPDLRSKYNGSRLMHEWAVLAGLGLENLSDALMRYNRPPEDVRGLLEDLFAAAFFWQPEDDLERLLLPFNRLHTGLVHAFDDQPYASYHSAVCEFTLGLASGIYEFLFGWHHEPKEPLDPIRLDREDLRRLTEVFLTKGLAELEWVSPTLKQEFAQVSAADGPQPEAAGDDAPLDCLVTLQQAAAMVSRSKKTLERRKADMPMPKVSGGGGKPDEWEWAEIRPWLEREFERRLPKRFPAERLRQADGQADGR